MDSMEFKVYWDKLNCEDKTKFANNGILRIIILLAFPYCSLCFFWKIIVPHLRYNCGTKNLESNKIDKNKMEDGKSGESSCKIDIEELKKNVSVSVTSDPENMLDLDNTENDPPKYTELFPTA